MESRTRFAIGGVSTVAASVAVICAVALTNSLALSDAAGSSIGAAPVVVPSSSVAEPEETPEPAPTPKPTSRPIETPKAPVAEVVPAPAPEVVTPRQDASSAEQPDGTANPPSEDDVIAEAETSGSWDSAREWAAGLGWTKERIDAWIARLEQSRGSLSGGQRDDGQKDASQDAGRVELGGSGGDSADGSQRRQRDSATDRQVSEPDTSTRVSADTSADTTQERSVTDSSKERPAHAGANADRRSMKPGVGAKEDRSRDSTERRD